MPALLAFALSLPEAWEDHPWGDTVVTVRKKIFAFVGSEQLTVKLEEAHAHALSIEGAAPTGYGLGKAGWVTVPIADVPPAVLRDWVEGELPARRAEAARGPARLRRARRRGGR